MHEYHNRTLKKISAQFCLFHVSIIYATGYSSSTAPKQHPHCEAAPGSLVPSIHRWPNPIVMKSIRHFGAWSRISNRRWWPIQSKPPVEDKFSEKNRPLWTIRFIKRVAIKRSGVKWSSSRGGAKFCRGRYRPHLLTTHGSSYLIYAPRGCFAKYSLSLAAAAASERKFSSFISSSKELERRAFFTRPVELFFRFRWFLLAGHGSASGFESCLQPCVGSFA